MIESIQATAQFGIDHGLDEAVSLGPAESGIGRGHLDEQPALGIEEAQDLIRHGVRQHTIHQSDRLEGAQRLVVEADPPGVVDQGVALLHHQSANTLQAKDVRQGQSGGPGPDDDDVDVVVGRHRRTRFGARVLIAPPTGSPDAAGRTSWGPRTAASARNPPSPRTGRRGSSRRCGDPRRHRRSDRRWSTPPGWAR